VGSALGVVADIDAEHVLELAPADNQQPVKALATELPTQLSRWAFAFGVLGQARYSIRRFDSLVSRGGEPGVEGEATGRAPDRMCWAEAEDQTGSCSPALGPLVRGRQEHASRRDA
jgi:hypothetical protein